MSLYGRDLLDGNESRCLMGHGHDDRAPFLFVLRMLQLDAWTERLATSLGKGSDLDVHEAGPSVARVSSDRDLEAWHRKVDEVEGLQHRIEGDEGHEEKRHALLGQPVDLAYEEWIDCPGGKR